MDRTGAIVEVYCSCPEEECVRRYNERAEGGLRHRAHFGKVTLEMFSEYGTPVGIGHLIEVDTTEPVDVDRLERRIREIWKDL